jgi:hypothetical protein
LEVLGLLVEMPGEGDVTALPLFRQGARILLSSLFGANKPLGFAIFSRVDVEDSFLASRHKLFLAGGH